MENRLNQVEQKDVANVRLEDDIKKMKLYQQELDQYSRNKNIEITGIEQTQREDVRQIVEKMAEKLEIENFTQDLIDKCHRVQSRNVNKPNAIIVQFKTREDRDRWVGKKKNQVTSDQIVKSTNKSKVYVNEHLTPFYKTLLWQTKQYAKKNNYKFVWIRNMKIHMRKDETDNAVRVIRSEEDLH